MDQRRPRPRTARRATWRNHEDTDLGIERRDASRLRSILTGWDIYVAAAGRLTRWTGQRLDVALHENNLWCRVVPGGPWNIDVTLGEGDHDCWVYRRDERLRLPWDVAVLQTADGIPYLAPDVQLLYKSTHLRPKDTLDAREVIPELDIERRTRLSSMLSGDHPWRQLLAAACR